MKNNQVLKIGKYGDHDLARLALRERLNSMLQFGRVSLKQGEEKPRYDVKSGKGVITRADGTVIFEASLAGLVENGEQVRLALVAFNRVLRERGILQFVRDNRDLRKLVNIAGSEVVLFGFDSRSKKRVQRYQLVRDIVLNDICVTLTALPKKLSDAVELGKLVEANFLAQLEAAKGDAATTAQLEELGVALGVLKATSVPAPKPKQADTTQSKPPKGEVKNGKKRRRGRKRNRKPTADALDSPFGGPGLILPEIFPPNPPEAFRVLLEALNGVTLPSPDAPEATEASAIAPTSEMKKKRRRRPRNRKGKAVVPQTTSEPATETVVEPAVEPQG